MEEWNEESLDISMANVQGFSSLIGDEDEGYNLGLAINSVSKNFQKWNNGFTRRRNLDCQRKSNSLENSWQELSEKNERRDVAAVSQKFASHSSDREYINKSKFFSPALSNARCRATRDDHCVAERIKTAVQQSAGTSWGEVPSFAMIPSVFSCDKKQSFPSPLQIKPKDVIHAVGQQLFWKARKAIVRQQEIFTNQVFELHKLIEVQRLLAKMPSTLIEDPRPFSKAFLGVAGAPDHEKGDCNKKHVISVEGAEKSTAPCNSGVEAHEPNPQQKLSTHQELAAAKSQQTKRRSAVSPLLDCSTKGPCSQALCSSITEGMAMWGYPIGLQNSPFLYPPVVGPFPPGSGVGAAYVLGSGPSLSPFLFPCYEVAPYFGFNNQWPNPVAHGSRFSPLPNDWFALSHPSQVPPASYRENLWLPNSVPSINMKAEEPLQSIQPAVLSLLSQQQQVGIGNETSMKAAKSAGTAASAGLSSQQDPKSEKPAAPGDVDDSSRVPISNVANRVMSESLRLCVGKRGACLRKGLR